MSYTIGAYIDLTYLNKRAAPIQKKSSFQATAQSLIEVGTEFIFKQNKTARRIPVIAA